MALTKLNCPGCELRASICRSALEVPLIQDNAAIHIKLTPGGIREFHARPDGERDVGLRRDRWSPHAANRRRSTWCSRGDVGR